MIYDTYYTLIKQCKSVREAGKDPDEVMMTTKAVDNGLFRKKFYILTTTTYGGFFFKYNHASALFFFIVIETIIFRSCRELERWYKLAKQVNL